MAGLSRATRTQAYSLLQAFQSQLGVTRIVMTPDNLIQVEFADETMVGQIIASVSHIHPLSFTTRRISDVTGVFWVQMEIHPEEDGPPAKELRIETSATAANDRWVCRWRALVPLDTREAILSDLLEDRDRMRCRGIPQKSIDWHTRSELAWIVGHRLLGLGWTVLRWAGVLAAAEFVKETAKRLIP